MFLGTLYAWGMSLGENTLASVLDRKRNGLNAIRLVLALGVIVWHSFPLTGRTIEWSPARHFMELAFVDGFFAISGFLIVGSWVNNPSVFRFLSARTLRIFPAFWVCLLVTAGVLAPLGIVLSGSGAPLWAAESVSYVIKNSLLWIFQGDIAGVTSGNPFPNSLNGSLWTLPWEFLCYLSVLALGLVGLLKFKVTIPLCFATAWVVLLATDLGVFDTNFIHYAARLGIAFTSGALVYVFADRLPVSRRNVCIAAAVVVVCMALPEYILFGGPFLAYAVIASGALIKDERIVLGNDLSYGTYIYAFPVQQLLVLGGLATLPAVVFAAVSVALTLPLAALSWFLVEKPAQRLKPGRKRRAVVLARP